MIDAWTGPTPTPQQFPPNEPNGIRKLLDKIAALELRIKESTSNLLRTAGIRLTKLGMFIDSSLTVGGSLDVTGPMVVGGTLSLPAGIIDNDALTSPTKSQMVQTDATNFALTTTYTTKVTSTITVPAGFTAAVIAITGRVLAFNTNSTGGADAAGADYLRARPSIAGVVGIPLPLVVAGSNSSVVNVAPMATVLTGLTPGGTFTITVEVKSDYQSWAANALEANGWNKVVLSGIISWSR